MTTGGLPVPPGFIITTEACGRYKEAGHLIGSAAAPVLAEIDDRTEPAEAYKRLHAVLTAAEDDEVGTVVPDDPRAQLERAIQAVFESWNSRRAVTYRNVHRISDTLGT